MNERELGMVMERLLEIADVTGRELTERAMALYLRQLGQFPLQDVIAALDAHIAHPERGQFMPKPADITYHILGNPSERATSAWTQVYNAIGRVGPWQSVEFADPLIHACIEQMGGWAKLCMISGDEVSFKARDFERIYATLLKHRPAELPAYLSGLEELNNHTQLGYKKLTPVKVGNGLLPLAQANSAMLQCNTTQQDKDAASVANGKLLKFKPIR